METKTRDASDFNPSIIQVIKHIFFKPKFSLNTKAIKEMIFDYEYANYKILKPLLSDIKFDKEEITMFYPGCGFDSVFPLLYLDILLTKKNKKVDLILNDINISHDLMCKAFQKVTGLNYAKKIGKARYYKKFRLLFKDKEIMLHTFESNVLEARPKILSKGIDIYFERGFKIIRESSENFLPFVLKHVRKKGLIIVDQRIDDPNLIKEFSLKEINKKIPKDFGFYKDLTIYRKE
ncbi:hypothetical protein D6745_04945 [Candidatus Woesearchaeota archaeon]|nr:MAG: hypothetical protein D6745_04945 [Candidatus Woesearchaeota archaeon]